MTGHTVLAVPVPGFEAVVRERTAHYDESFVSGDPDFVHAHVTVLAPWLPAPTSDDLAIVAGIAAGVEPFEVTFASIEQMPSGLIHAVPVPDGPLRALTAALSQAFGMRPYAGEFGDPDPHLTLDHAAGGASLEHVRAEVGPLLPVRMWADRIDLQWWANHDCRLLTSFPLGSGVG